MNSPDEIEINKNAELVPESFWKRIVTRVAAPLERRPWLLPAISFCWGWISFILVKRGENLARTMAFLAFIGWPWLLVEPFIRKYLEKITPGNLTKLAIDFVTQSLQQELLFFALPFILGATQWDVGQVLFSASVIGAALLSTIDPIYNKWIAHHTFVKRIFHAYCSWLAALVVLPMVVHLPLEQATPAALIFIIAWFAITLRRTLLALPSTTLRAIWITLCVTVPIFIWITRTNIPAAGLTVKEARITQSITDLIPGDPVSTLNTGDLQNGVIAFVAIRAPMGLSQGLVFEWHHDNYVDKIPAEIQGGSVNGYRTWSRKKFFTEKPIGKWTVEVRTPQGQLLKRLRFDVEQ